MAPVDLADPSYIVRHSTAHVMAQAVKEMFPEAKLGWGPPHDRFANGFYYDFNLLRDLTPGLALFHPGTQLSRFAHALRRVEG